MGQAGINHRKRERERERERESITHLGGKAGRGKAAMKYKLKARHSASAKSTYRKTVSITV
jgi:hypothetical protein